MFSLQYINAVNRAANVREVEENHPDEDVRQAVTDALEAGREEGEESGYEVGREDGLEDGIIEGQERVKETATVDLLEALRLSGIDILDPVSITYDSIFGLTYSQGPFRYSPERY